MPQPLCQLFAGAVIVLVASHASAFKVQVKEIDDYFSESPTVKSWSYASLFETDKPVHQDMTIKTLGNCTKPETLCSQLKAKTGIEGSDVVRSVVWNDFPAFYMDRNAPSCMKRVLRIAQNGDVHCFGLMLMYASGNNHKYKSNRAWALSQPLGARGHFGDLQFWHAMSMDGVSSGETYDNIRMWMELAFRTSLGEFDLNADITTLPVPGIQAHFWSKARRLGDLMDYHQDERAARAIALGQILHIAQDSFSKCHAKRDSEGKLERYYSYTLKSIRKHGYYDGDDQEIKLATSRALNPYDFGERLIALRIKASKWEDVRDEFYELVRIYFRPAVPGYLARVGEGCV